MWRHVACVWVLACGGCNQVLGLDRTELRDEGIDRDEDGVDDLVDNCRDDPNLEQSDEDGDGLGDVCDNCPLVANFQQTDDGDADGTGDACDPNPDIAGDCLVMLDSFLAPEAFDAGWRVMPETARTRIAPAAGSVVIASGAAMAMFARTIDPAANLQVKVRTRWAMGIGAVLATVSLAATPISGYRCQLAELGGRLYVASAADNGTDGAVYDANPLSGPPLSDAVVLRLSVPLETPLTIRCRIDYGVAVGAALVEPTAPPPSGTGAGLMVANLDVVVEAVAVYQRAAGPCPAMEAR